MELKESIDVALEAMRTNKMRSLLTTLGIVIGVMTIISMMSIIKGLQNYMVQELTVLGSNTFQVQRDPPIQMGRLDEKYRNRKILTRQQAEAIKERAKAVKFVGAEVWRWGQVLKYKDKKTNPDIVVAGGTPEFQVNNGYFVEDGRFISETDVEHNRMVVVLGMDIVEVLFPFEDPIGKEIKIEADKFKVIGVLEEQGESFGQSKDNIVIIPISTFEKLYGNKRSINITVQAKSAELMETAQEQVISILRTERKVPPGKPNDFEIWTSESLIKTFNDLTKYVKIAAVGICLISLLVGGIGVMNIMLVSVTERTREIGIRKAVGARRLDILWQFIVEAIILSEIGGLIGVIIGVLIGLLVKAVTPLPTAVPIWAIILGLGFCSLVGLFFGIYPAAKAARLDPIIALRYE